jgi:hypothetical protein
VDGEALAVESGQEEPELAHRAAADWERPVPGRSPQRHAQRADLLLGDHDRVEPAPGDVHREAAELADREAEPLEELRVLVDHEARAGVPAAFFVAQKAQDDVAWRRCVRFGRLKEGGNIIATPPLMSSAPLPHT